MKTENMKVLLYLKKIGLEKLGKAPIMGRRIITANITKKKAINNLSRKNDCFLVKKNTIFAKTNFIELW